MSDGPDDQETALSALAQGFLPEGSRRRTVAHWIMSHLTPDIRTDVEEYDHLADDDDDITDTCFEPESRGSAADRNVTHIEDIAATTSIHEPLGRRPVTLDSRVERPFTIEPLQVQSQIEPETQVDGKGDLDRPDLYSYAASVVDAALCTLKARTHRGTWKVHDYNNLDFDFGALQQSIKSLYQELDTESQKLSESRKEEHRAEMTRVREGSSPWDFGVYGSVDVRRNRRELHIQSSGLGTMSHLDGWQLGSLPTNWKGR